MTDQLEDDEPSVLEIEGSLSDHGESGVLTEVFRGTVQYAYREGPWLTLMYGDGQKVLKLRIQEPPLVVTGNYYEQTKH